MFAFNSFVYLMSKYEYSEYKVEMVHFRFDINDMKVM